MELILHSYSIEFHHYDQELFLYNKRHIIFSKQNIKGNKKPLLFTRRNPPALQMLQFKFLHKIFYSEQTQV